MQTKPSKPKEENQWKQTKGIKPLAQAKGQGRHSLENDQGQMTRVIFNAPFGFPTPKQRQADSQLRPQTETKQEQRF